MPKDMSAAEGAAANPAAVQSWRTAADRARSYGAADGESHTARRRFLDYDLFERQALDFFASPPTEPRHARMAETTGFVAAATSTGGARGFEVAYGARPAPQRRRAGGQEPAEWRDETEAGAALAYRQGPDGVMTVYLYPARSDSFGPEEDGIFLGRLQDLAKVTGRGALESHWRALRSYAETTSLDGEPSLIDRARVAWLRFSRPTFSGGRMGAARAEPALEIAAVAAAAMFAAATIASWIA